jgi:hypothetical protein
MKSMQKKHHKAAKDRSETLTTKAPKVEPTPKEEALAELARAVDPLIRALRQAMREHAQAKADRIEATYNDALDVANAKYERWSKAHGEDP